MPTLAENRAAGAAIYEQVNALRAEMERVERSDSRPMRIRGSAPLGSPAGVVGDSKVLTRAEFDLIPPYAQGAFFRDGGRIRDLLDEKPVALPSPSGVQMSRAEWDKLGLRAKANYFRQGGRLKD